MAAGNFATYLLEQAILPEAIIEAALQRQVVLGGSVDTNLLEMAAIEEEILEKALAGYTQGKTANRAAILAVPKHLPQLLPVVFAETYHLVPFALQGDTLEVLVSQPPEPQLATRIFERLHLRIVPRYALEVRLHFAMNQLYGSELLPRYTTLLASLDQEITAQNQGLQDPPQKTMLGWGISQVRISPARGESGHFTAKDMRALVARLDVATDRDTIVDLVLSFALVIFEYVGLFWLQGKTLQGWRSTDPQSTQRIAQATFSLAQDSVLKTVVETGGHYLGPLPNNKDNAQLLSAMGRLPPHAAFVGPLRVGDKLAAVLYADNSAKPIAPKRVAALLLLLQRAGLALERLIRQRKELAYAQAQRSRLASESLEQSPQATPELAAKPPSSPPPSSQAPSAHPESLVQTTLQQVGQAPPPPSTAPSPPSPTEVQFSLEATHSSPQTSSPANHPEHPASPSLTHWHRDEVAIEVDIDPVFTTKNDYVAFADVQESAQASVDEWEDVFIDTVTEQKDTSDLQQASPKQETLPLGPTWQDVILAARKLADISPMVEETVSVLGQTIDSRVILFDGLESSDSEARQSAVARILAMGHSCDALMMERFPGNLRQDPFTSAQAVLPFAQLSGITELLASKGVEAAPLVAPCLEHPDKIHRYVAINYFLNFHYPPICESLARRLYDSEGKNRYLAIEALRRYSSEPAYHRLIEGLREQLLLQRPEVQSTVMQILGQLREPSAVPSMIPLLSSAQPQVVRTALSALVIICAQTFGQDVQLWQQWWRSHHRLPRSNWLLSGLMHQNLTIRKLAHNELQHLIGRALQFQPDASETERQAMIASWQHMVLETPSIRLDRS